MAEQALPDGRGNGDFILRQIGFALADQIVFIYEVGVLILDLNVSAEGDLQDIYPLG